MSIKYMGTEEFGRSLNPPRSEHTVTRLCRLGRIQGAIKPNRDWLIPSNARIKGVNSRIEDGRGNSGMSVKRFAEINGVTRSRVYQLLWDGRIEGAVKTEHGWSIPKGTPWPGEEEEVGDDKPALEPVQGYSGMD